jgi:hypothetical protein
MRPALATLRLNVSSDAAAKVIAKYPSVLTLLPETLAAKFFFLRETCGMDAERIEKLVSSSPSILTLSVERNLAPTFSFLKDELHLGESGARAVLAKAPSVFGLRRENVGPKFAFFAERAGRDAAVAIFAKAPSLLGTSLERNIAPTATWIVETCGIVGFGDGGGDENDERISVEEKENVGPARGGRARELSFVAGHERRAQTRAHAFLPLASLPKRARADSVPRGDVLVTRARRAARRASRRVTFDKPMGARHVPRVERRRVLRQDGNRPRRVRRKSARVQGEGRRLGN